MNHHEPPPLSSASSDSEEDSNYNFELNVALAGKFLLSSPNPSRSFP